MYFYLLTDEE